MSAHTYIIERIRQRARWLKKIRISYMGQPWVFKKVDYNYIVDSGWIDCGLWRIWIEK